MMIFGLGSAFQPSLIVPNRRGAFMTSSTKVNGMFDFITDAFSNTEYDNRRVEASHILVPSEEKASEIKVLLLAGEQTFAEAAQAFSSCPSSQKGGSLGGFEPGKMVKEFDTVCFDESIPVGEVVGPLKTQFGYHLIRVDKRFENQNRSEGTGIG
eukprot:CAMPEP_0171312900 /NCGR_PEP_ID=MMETSP0816-20121228/34314_1 /TAXON_ID=420281 /ORGANISM="Proboscia inermis, Strain CCAP1064/1" /LENGTH=154 /DNA_ID=CAMNT_0011799289 /DNA_START=146 /DNA_END=610 /DNA_ORIENTATION=+